MDLDDMKGTQFLTGTCLTTECHGLSLTATYDIWWSAFGSKIGCIVQINCLKCKREEEKSQIKMEMDLNS